MSEADNSTSSAAAAAAAAGTATSSSPSAMTPTSTSKNAPTQSSTCKAGEVAPRAAAAAAAAAATAAATTTTRSAEASIPTASSSSSSKKRKAAATSSLSPPPPPPSSSSSSSSSSKSSFLSSVAAAPAVPPSGSSPANFGASRGRGQLPTRTTTTGNRPGVKRPRPSIPVPKFSQEASPSAAAANSQGRESQTLSQDSMDGTRLPRPPIREPILCLRSVQDTRTAWPLDSARQRIFSIGRNANVVDIVATGQRVSREHAELHWDAKDACWRLVDKSSGGVWVNERRIPKASVLSGKSNGDLPVTQGYPLQILDRICFGHNLPESTFTLECWTSPLARLVVLQQDSTGIAGSVPQHFCLDARTRRTYAIGRSQKMVQIAVVHAMLSRVHMQLEYTVTTSEGARNIHKKPVNGASAAPISTPPICHWTATDRVSRNGTFLNGSRISPRASHTLSHGDQLVLGDISCPAVTLRFEYLAGALGRGIQRPTGGFANAGHTTGPPIQRKRARDSDLVSWKVQQQALQQQIRALEAKAQAADLKAQQLERKASEVKEVEKVVIQKVVEKDTEMEAKNAELQQQQAALQAQIAALQQQMKAAAEKEVIKEVEVVKEVEKVVPREVIKEVIKEVEKVVKDPETEAQNAQLQAQRAELQHQIEMLEAKQKEVAAVAERNARVKADMIEYSWSCCICTEYLVKSRLLACGHTFCQSCIEEWLEVNSVCPKCREPVKSPPLPNTVLDETLSKIILELKDCGEQAAKDYQERLDEWEETYSESKKRTMERQGGEGAQTAAAGAAAPANTAYTSPHPNDAGATAPSSSGTSSDAAGHAVDLTGAVQVHLEKNTRRNKRCDVCKRVVRLGEAVVRSHPTVNNSNERRTTYAHNACWHQTHQHSLNTISELTSTVFRYRELRSMGW